jgi:hypothetical protein
VYFKFYVFEINQVNWFLSRVIHNRDNWLGFFVQGDIFRVCDWFFLTPVRVEVDMMHYISFYQSQEVEARLQAYVVIPAYECCN